MITHKELRKQILDLGINKTYDISPENAILILEEVMTLYFDTPDIIFLENGLHINNKYKNLSNKDMRSISSMYEEALLKNYSEEVRDYILNTIYANKMILYCRLERKSSNYYYLKPFLSKDVPLKYVEVLIPININVIFPENITTIPIELETRYKFKKVGPNLFHTRGHIMTEKTGRIHIDLLNKRLLKKMAFDAELNFIQVFFDKNVNILFIKAYSKKKLPTSIIRYCENYFKSFNVTFILQPFSKLHEVLPKNSH